MPEASCPQRAPNVVDMQDGPFHAPDCPRDSGRMLANINWSIPCTHEAGEREFTVRHTGLAEWLREAGINEIFVAGMNILYCVDTPRRAAANRGFRATLMTDAHTCMDTSVLLAAQISAAKLTTTGVCVL